MRIMAMLVSVWAIMFCHDCNATILCDNGEYTFYGDVENKTISIELSQQDTLNYETGNILLQTKIKLDSGRVIASRIITTSMNRILEEGIL